MCLFRSLTFNVLPLRFSLSSEKMWKLHTHPPTQWRSNINLDWLVLIGATFRTLHVCADFLRRMKPSAACKKETHSNNEKRDVKMSVYRNLSFLITYCIWVLHPHSETPGPAQPGPAWTSPIPSLVDSVIMCKTEVQRSEDSDGWGSTMEIRRRSKYMKWCEEAGRPHRDHRRLVQSHSR